MELNSLQAAMFLNGKIH